MLHQAALVIHALLACLFALTVGITIERIIVLRRHKNDVSSDGAALEEFLRSGNFNGARMYFRGRPSVAAQIIAVSLRHHTSLGAEKAAQGAALLLRERLERGLTLLATLGNNAPFLGLLGTVLGIVGAFASLGEAHHNKALMGAISEALIATAVGLVVALPAVVAYNHLQRQIDGMFSESEALSGLVIAYVEQEAPRGSERSA